MIYGLVAPGYDMAEIVGRQPDRPGPHASPGADMSTKLKLMGVDVASFGNAFADEKGARAITFEDPFRGTYKKLLFNPEGTHLLGGILVGDASEYAHPARCSPRAGQPLPVPPGELMGLEAGDSGPQAAQHWPTTPRSARATTSARVPICAAIRDKSLGSVDEVKKCTRAGTGCGGCLPLVTDLFKAELKTAGQDGQQRPLRALRVHPPGAVPDRQDQGDQVVRRPASPSHGKGHGCEVCKPAVASILASLWNENIVEHTTIQDTNDRFLANIQRGGTLLGRPARAGRGDHAREAHRPRAGGQEVRPLHEDHRRPAGRPVRGPGASSFRTSGRSWSTPGSRAGTPTGRPCAR